MKEQYLTHVGGGRICSRDPVYEMWENWWMFNKDEIATNFCTTYWVITSTFRYIILYQYESTHVLLLKYSTFFNMYFSALV